jgi:glycosyltransferase involved in cell wall biosynthesis
MIDRKILHITNSSGGGAGIAAIRLHNSLIANNICSGFLSKKMTIGFDGKEIEDDFFKYNKLSLINRIFKKIIFLSSYKKSHRFIKKWIKIKPSLEYIIVSFPFSKFRINKHPLFKQADIIHLHWIGDLIDYPSFFKECKKPIIWTLHDKNPILGIFHYKNDEIFNKDKILSFNNYVKKIKRESVRKIENGIIVSPSQSLNFEAENSTIFNHLIKVCIPNSIDLNIFNVKGKTSLRRKNNFSENEFIILFVANSITNKWKGLDLLINALRLIKLDKITLITVGEGFLPKIENLEVINFGKIDSDVKMSEIYSLSDVLISPSLEDNLPNIMLEAFGCGIPMISFKIGGFKDHIKNGITGYLAASTTSESLADSILLFYETKNKFDKFKIRKYAENNFSFEKQSKAYIDLYDKVLKNN